MSKEREALKLARDVLLPYKSTWLRWYTDVDEALDAIEEVLAQPEREPVAIVDANDEGYWADILPDRNVKVGDNLYTAPPQRPWVGLDFETIEECFPEGPSVFEDAYGDNHTSPRWLHAFARAIESRLKEKNT